MPILAKEPLGVLEIATFRLFPGASGSRTDQALPVVALSLEVLQLNLHTQNLLDQTREQALQPWRNKAGSSRRARSGRAKSSSFIVACWNAAGCISRRRRRWRDPPGHNEQSEKLFGYSRPNSSASPSRTSCPTKFGSAAIRRARVASPRARRRATKRDGELHGRAQRRHALPRSTSLLPDPAQGRCGDAGRRLLHATSPTENRRRLS